MLIWPLPALLTWGLAWGVYLTLRELGLGGASALLLAVLVSAVLAWRGRTAWRRVFMFAGFPLSVLATGLAGGVSAAWWLLPLVLLLLLYPRNTWADAPLFPTPVRALQGLAQAAPLPPGAAVLDAGCGLGAGLKALREQYPEARLEGWEWSWPLARLCAWRCRFARVQRADIWAQPWSGFDLVYLFQRPESMARALHKATEELAPGAWLVSLEFEAVGWVPQGRLQTLADKPVWLYRAPFQPAQAAGTVCRADKPHADPASVNATAARRGQPPSRRPIRARAASAGATPPPH